MTPRPFLVVGDTRAVLSGFTPEPVSLAALIESGVPIEWYEGVAIVQEASRHVLDPSTHQSSSALSVATVRIDLRGTVFVPGSVQDGPAAVSQLGGLLRDLLRDNVPVPLRLAISQAMSNPPYYASIKSFSDALAYFERPDRPNIIRTLYQRWDVHARGRSATPPHNEPASEREPDAVAPASPKPRTAETGVQRWKVVAWSIGLAFTLALVLLAVWVRGSNDLSVARQMESSAPLPDPSTETVVAESPAKTTEPGATTGMPVATPAVRAAATADTKATSRIQSARPESERPLPETVAAPVLPVAPPTPAALLPSGASQQPAYQPNTIANQTPQTVKILEAAPGSHIYSAIDTDVAAPVAEYPQSSSVATVMHDDEMLVFDAVIDQTGKVESVKLRYAPSSIRSTLLLTMSMSVAKAWRFQPAIRHGQSVKYRQSFSVPAPR